MLYAALSDPVGISYSVDVGKVESFRQQLYQQRAKLKDPALDDLGILPDPERPATHLWIVKKKVQVDEAG